MLLPNLPLCCKEKYDYGDVGKNVVKASDLEFQKEATMFSDGPGEQA